jgi:hypothetical protein
MKKSKSNIEIVSDYLEGKRPFIQIGYEKKKIKRKDGDKWEDSKGISWERKNGANIRVNKQADLIRKLTEQKCVCGQEIKFGNRYDQILFPKTGLCYDCTIKEETKLRVLGVYPLYEKKKLTSNYLSELKMVKEKIVETIKYFTENDGKISMLCNEEGFIQNFIGTNKDMILEDARKDLIKINEEIEVVSKNYEKIKKEFEDALLSIKNE